jgi:hypothetical protein
LSETGSEELSSTHFLLQTKQPPSPKEKHHPPTQTKKKLQGKGKKNPSKKAANKSLRNKNEASRKQRQQPK